MFIGLTYNLVAIDPIASFGQISPLACYNGTSSYLYLRKRFRKIVFYADFPTFPYSLNKKIACMNSRRDFLQKLTGSAIAFSFLPNHLLAEESTIDPRPYDGPMLRVA